MSAPENTETVERSASRPLVVYHGDCPDGFGAAFAAWKRFGEDADYVPVNHGDPPPNARGRHVLMADFAYDRGTTEKLALASASLVVLDHHRSAASELGDLPYCVFDMNR
ncbi:MAG: phosphoesterase, partial [Candidatus Dormiibacterota bacterium]